MVHFARARSMQRMEVLAGEASARSTAREDRLDARKALCGYDLVVLYRLFV